ncbi:MAG: hypothetical protein CMD08_04360 [Flavobacteriales bacterium]|nr:hypothetical protein [Flavobacteriales bacterium]
MVDKNIAILGLGYVGLTLAVSMAEKGFNITGIETNKKILNVLLSKKPHFYEPNLSQKFKKQIDKGNLKITDKIIKKNNFTGYIICVGTPLIRNKPNLNYIKNATREVSKNLNDKSIIIYRSTVPIGTTENILKPILDKNCNNIDYEVCYCPERTAQGSALIEIRKMPQIIGGLNRKSSFRAQRIFKKFNPQTYIVKNTTTAEIIKLVDNTQRDVFFSYANEISEISNNYNVSSKEILKIAALNYPRTSKLLPGPVGGPCLSKDSHILLSSLSNKFKRNSMIYKARTLNENIYFSCLNFLKKNYNLKNKKLIIGFYGIAFKGKPQTDDTRGSIVHDFIKEFKLINNNVIFLALDNKIKSENFTKLNLKKILDPKILFIKSNIIINLNNNDHFKKIKLNNLSKLMKKNSIIYDYWNNFEKEKLKLENNVKYIAYGSEKI